ncbi:bifunctional allantoicase/(S)-ureidoglycine aminohydrolase [Histidinibacterium lentulum]|uniref:(S)-ureidoglycine aminohydrolase n=1 Tax=Histidinibacterium lentulum TaxID=2480588 RepID=A0A3N2QYP4_9RHOB|nr:bifunctional allantoicase/(S)-ureidoglycine aminohydrolase [Histidinibacterium lentulum]ROU00327.1 (S)-ureidoglycine aminohydrolase [Histidinibacterium lentulum]
MTHSYFSALGGHAPQDQLLTGRAVFTEAYAVLPRGTMQDITASALPHWDRTRLWILARPLSGFAETFSHYVMEVAPGGGSERPEPDPEAEGALFVTAGTGTLALDGAERALAPGSFAYLPPGTDWTLRNSGTDTLSFHWLRKAWEPAPGLEAPDAFVTSDAEVAPSPMAGTEGRWATTRFMDPADLRHDMHVTIVTLEPGAVIPFMETHVMEHGLYVLQGKGVYRLNRDWVEVEAGDYMWLRAFCPQACYAGGPEPFRYLLYKDVNRHPRLRPFGPRG